MNLSGIDKTTVKGFSVVSIDFEKLERTNKAVIMRDTKNSLYQLMDGTSFEYVKIRDDTFFKMFQAGIKLTGGAYVRYGFIDISIAPLDGNNLVPLSIRTYQTQILKMFKYLEEVYGVRCGALENVKFEILELNATIQLDYPFDSYIRVLQTLMSIAPKTYKSEHMDKDRRSNTVDNLVIRNKSLQVKFYNKGKQLEEVYELDMKENLLRIEYTFLKNTKIMGTFGTSKVNELTDNHIKIFIINRFTSDFAVPYHKLRISNHAKLKRLVAECKANNKNWINKMKEYFWRVECERRIPVLLDIEDFLELVRTEDKVNYSKNKKRILNDFPTTYFNQHQKYEEIFKKVAEI